MKKLSILFLLFLPFVKIQAQCFSIENILVNACGEPEGENEMVTLRVYNQMDIDDLVFNWPNNSFLGWCSNPSTTSLLNQSITTSCGFLIEPSNGIVPAGQKLLAVTSTNVLVSANSFANLSDTLYIIYQCSGNTRGHFRNSATGTQTFTINYNGSCSSSQSINYLSSSLVGGDGAALSFDEQGNLTYYNTDCNAPIPTLSPNWDISNQICEDYGLIDLNDLLSDNATTGGIWSGDVVNGHFFNTTDQSGTFTITYTAIDNSGCTASSDSTLSFSITYPNTGRDTIIRCDSIKQFGFWITQDTVIDILLENSNPYKCDSTLKRFYKINHTDFSISPTEITLNSGNSFDFNISSSNSYSYSFWNEDGGDTCIFPCYETSITPSNQGNYIFEVLDELNSCIIFLNIDVSLNYFSQLNIPTIFTPNNDGQNDLFKLYGKDIQYVNYQIYSQWGELIFEGNNLNDYWDGNFKNEPLASSIFLVQIKASGKDGQKYDRIQKIKLVR